MARVFIYIYIHICVYICVYIYKYTYFYICMFKTHNTIWCGAVFRRVVLHCGNAPFELMYIYIYVIICIYIYVYIYIYIYISHMNKRIHMRQDPSTRDMPYHI